MKRRFQKVQKDFVLPHSLPASPKKLIYGPKISKIGCSLHIVMSCAVGKPGTLNTDVEPSSMNIILL